MEKIKFIGSVIFIATLVSALTYGFLFEMSDEERKDLLPVIMATE